MGGVPFPKIPSYFFGFLLGGRLVAMRSARASDLRPSHSAFPLLVPFARGTRFAVPIVRDIRTFGLVSFAR